MSPSCVPAHLGIFVFILNLVYIETRFILVESSLQKQYKYTTKSPQTQGFTILINQNINTLQYLIKNFLTSQSAGK